ncbi:AAA family ATPase [Methanobrevibacter sp.]|uniref:AAA family ATPase n=1 Tax=Methanobrevibacter sp. TaxID=66852 RepID=UPI00386DFB0D
MIIKSLEMKNYRPYRDPPIINFAYGEKNLTIIEGDNDLGKTTFLSAISWCIYGDDEHYKKHSKPICNCEAAKELKKGQSLTVEVEVVMEDNEGRDVFFNRKQNYKKASNGKMRRDGKDDFTVYKKSGTNDIPLGDPKGYRETRLPNRLQEYFLFDGERLLEWFGGDTNIVKEEIEKLSQSNLIQNVIDRTQIQKDDLNDDLNELNEELADLNTQKENLISSNKDDIKKLEDNKKKIKELTEENDDLKRSLSPEGEGPEELLKEIENLEKDIKFDEEQLNDLNKNHLEFLLGNFSRILSQDLLKTFTKRKIEDDSIDENSMDDEHIYSISSKDLEYILDRKKCMCGNDFNEDDLAFELLSNLRKKAVKYENNSSLNKTVKDLINDANAILNEIPNSFQEDVSKYWNKVNVFEERIETRTETLETKKESYETLVDAIDDEKKIRSQISTNTKLIDGFKENNGIIQKNIEEFEPEKQRIERELELLKINLGDEKEISDKIDFCDEIIKHCEFLKEELGRKIHKSIEEGVNKQFKKIYNGDGTRNKYDAVLIDEKFNISLRETDGLEITSINPSSGAQLAVALSFITSINSSTKFKLPQIMDTSIGRWGNRLRKNFADVMPQLLDGNQLIFLLLDSENSSEFHDKIRGNVGKEYELQFVTKDETTIVDVTKERIGE